MRHDHILPGPFAAVAVAGNLAERTMRRRGASLSPHGFGNNARIFLHYLHAILIKNLTPIMHRIGFDLFVSFLSAFAGGDRSGPACACVRACVCVIECAQICSCGVCVCAWTARPLRVSLKICERRPLRVRTHATNVRTQRMHACKSAFRFKQMHVLSGVVRVCACVCASVPTSLNGINLVALELFY